MPRPVFTDASSAILLEKTGVFDAFSKTFRIIFSASVFTEITRPGYPGADFFMVAFDNNVFDVVSYSETILFPCCPGKQEMDLGERETLCLFLEKKQGYLLIDDGRAARWCRDKGLPFINALLVPKILWYTGLMGQEDCLSKMEFLCRTGRYSQKIKDLAFSFEEKDLSFFILEKNNDSFLF